MRDFQQGGKKKRKWGYRDETGNLCEYKYRSSDICTAVEKGYCTTFFAFLQKKREGKRKK
jgi:hypothetical protein